MDLWDAVGITPKTALLVAAAGLVVAGLMALVTFRREHGRGADSALRLGDPD